MRERLRLLAAEDLRDFLSVLHGDLNRLQVLELLRPHGGPGTPQAISGYASRGRLPSPVQVAYIRAFGLADDHEVCAHLQLLASGAPAAPAARVA